MESVQGQQVEVRLQATGSAERARKAVLDWYQPTGDTEKDHLGRDVESIAMQGNGEPRMFFARAEGNLNALPALGIHKLDSEVVRILARRLPSDVHEVEQRTSLLRPGITRSGMEGIVRTFHANRKTKTLEKQHFAAVVSAAAAPLVDPHALAVGGGFQSSGAGKKLGGAEQQQQQPQQPRQQQHHHNQHGAVGQQKQHQYGATGRHQHGHT